MVKVFTLNKAGKIELTKDELQKLLDEAYWEGYRANNNWTYVTPGYSYSPWITTTGTGTGTGTSTNITENPYTITYGSSSSGDANITINSKGSK